MGKIREPRNRERFIPADVAIARLRGLASELERLRGPDDLMHWEAKVWHWNDNWNKPDRTVELDHIVASTCFSSGPPSNPEEVVDEPNNPIP